MWFGTHSFHIGAPSTVAAMGNPLMILGGWGVGDLLVISLTLGGEILNYSPLLTQFSL